MMVAVNKAWGFLGIARSFFFVAMTMRVIMATFPVVMMMMSSM